MDTQYITNDKGERTAVIVPIHEYEDLIHKQHLGLELTEEYKRMIDEMLKQESDGTAKYVNFESIKNKYQPIDETSGF